MANDKTADPRWLAGFGLMLVAIVMVYLLTVSSWYSCGAQIDPGSLTPVCRETLARTACRPAVAPPTANPNFEQKIWPDFGAGNRDYDSVSSFWGDDIVSKAAGALLDAAARISRPSVTALVLRWNHAMSSPVNRRALYGAVVLVLGAVATEWAKDVYRSLRRPARGRD